MMRKSWTKWILIAVIALALIVGVPIIINECYKTNSGYMTIWGAADALSYYGTILGALVAVATVVVTILFTYKQIQRDSFLKSENEKWAKIEEIFAMALDTINPIRPMTEAMDTGMKNPGAAITTFQKYQMACKIASDQLIAFLNGADYQKVKTLLERANQATEEFSHICDEEIAIYERLLSFSGRQTAERTVEMEAAHPASFSEDTLTFCRTIIDKTNGITLDALTKELAASNEKMVSAYETKYRDLLQLKGQTFEVINAETRKKADSILLFGGNFYADT